MLGRDRWASLMLSSDQAVSVSKEKNLNCMVGWMNVSASTIRTSSPRVTMAERNGNGNRTFEQPTMSSEAGRKNRVEKISTDCHSICQNSFRKEHRKASGKKGK